MPRPKLHRVLKGFTLLGLLLGVLMGLVGLLFVSYGGEGGGEPIVAFRGATFDAELAGVTLLVTGALLVVVSLLWLRYDRIR
jgi:drug/metabolite transporter (DMT)-like permease